jgi:aminopeptidase-like protein
MPSGAELHTIVATLYPLCRSITGTGLRDTLAFIGRQIPLAVTEVASGTRVLDWEVPPEWTVRSARLSTLDGRTVVDFAEHNLHLVQYSVPVDRVVTRAELEPHLHSLPAQPDLIGYRTSYYERTWGFCLPHRLRTTLTDAAYRVQIDTSIQSGSLSYGECVLPGEEAGEVLISAHCCHPSLANDNLSSIAVAIGLAQHLAAMPRRRFTWRLLFAPGTIGAICWLAANPDAPARVRHGLVLTCLGDAAPPTYKRSRRGTAEIDRYMAHALHARGHAGRIVDFSPTGYDERQYGSPGFNLPMGCLMRSPAGMFPEYHTSADNPEFVRPAALADSLALLCDIADMIERDRVWRNTAPYGEPQLGKRGLYAAEDRMALLWALNLGDGEHSLFDIAERAALPFRSVAGAAERLQAAGLLVRAVDYTSSR